MLERAATSVPDKKRPCFNPGSAPLRGAARRKGVRISTRDLDGGWNGAGLAYSQSSATRLRFAWWRSRMLAGDQSLWPHFFAQRAVRFHAPRRDAWLRLARCPMTM